MRYWGWRFVLVLVFAFNFRATDSKRNHGTAYLARNASLNLDQIQDTTMRYGPPVPILSNVTSGSRYSKWTKWSRCIDCLQRRMKSCIDPSCHNSRMYEERECHKKRCSRKRRKLISTEFNIVHLNTSRSYLMKQGYSTTWSRWTKWSECSIECLTTRYRSCRKPGRCKTKFQAQKAYCYHERTRCETYVLDLIQAKEDFYKDNRKYHYTYQNNKYIARESRKQCGITFSKPQMLKIIGGSEAQKYKWPWHAALLNHFNEVFCGGTLIAARWVLTASHCIRKHLKVRLMAHDLLARKQNEIDVHVSEAFRHPGFEIKTVDNDIALLLLSKPVRVPVACLPTRKPRAGQLCSVMGWGKVRTSDSYGVPVLHEAKLPLVPHQKCRKAYKEFLISPNMMCAGWKSGKADTCSGDSGGGLMCPNRKMKYSVQGITSFGDGCGGKNKFGIYTAVYKYNRWINHIMDHYS